MPARDPVLTPELVRIMKIFLLSSLSFVLIFSFFNSYRADNTHRDRTFQMSDSNRLFFMNVRSIHYDREYRKDAGMSLFRHRKRFQSDTLPSLDPVLILNTKKEEAYIYFELQQGEFPVHITASSDKDTLRVDFSGGNNEENYALFQKLKPFWENSADFEIEIQGKVYPIWGGENELEVLKTVSEDYFRLLNQSK